jgi:hypothetical protein
MAVVYSGNAEGDGLIHKSKMNSNGTFSVGKTWRLNELRGVEVTDVSCTFVSVSLRTDTDTAVDIQRHSSEDVQVANRESE